MKFLLREADGVVVASRGLLEFCRKYNKNEERKCYVPNSVDLTEFNPRKYKRVNQSHDQITFAWTGILYSFVNWKLLIKAFAEMKNTNTKLLIIGRGPAEKILEKYIIRLGIKDRVKLMGWLPHYEVPKVLASADVASIPSHNTLYDACKCPIKLSEYMAMELPIVSTNIGEPAYMIKKIGCGLVTPVDYRRFADAMDIMARDIEYWKRRGRLGRIYPEKFQNWDILSIKLVEFLYKVVQSGFE